MPASSQTRPDRSRLRSVNRPTMTKLPRRFPRWLRCRPANTGLKSRIPPRRTQKTPRAAHASRSPIKARNNVTNSITTLPIARSQSFVVGMSPVAGSGSRKIASPARTPLTPVNSLDLQDGNPRTALRDRNAADEQVQDRRKGSTKDVSPRLVHKQSGSQAIMSIGGPRDTVEACDLLDQSLERAGPPIGLRVASAIRSSGPIARSQRTSLRRRHELGANGIAH